MIKRAQDNAIMYIREFLEHIQVSDKRTSSIDEAKLDEMINLTYPDMKLTQRQNKAILPYLEKEITNQSDSNKNSK